MSNILSAKDICERSLRAIGAFPVTESAPDGEQLREAMFWLDMELAELSGTNPLLFQQQEPTGFALTPGEREYRLSNAMGSAYPSEGIQFPRGAWLQDEDGNRYDVTIISRSAWNAKAEPEQEGRPEEVYLDRLLEGPTLYTFPTLPEDEEETWTLYLDVQTFSPNVAPGGVTGKQPQGSIKTLMRPAWQRWAVFRNAMDIGAGPVAKISESSLTRFQKYAEQALAELLAFENREHDTEVPGTMPWGMD